MTEKQLHIAICQYIKMQYPNVYFLSDPSGIRMSIGMAVQLKKTRSNDAQLDIVILEPNNTHRALILEVKRDFSEVFKKDMTYRNNKHVKDQNKSIKKLDSKGYFAVYVFSFDMAVEIIDKYLNNKL